MIKLELCKLFILVLVCFFALHSGVLQCNGAELTVQAENAVQIQPTYEGEPLSVTAILVCNIQPANASVRTRWILPDGHITQNDQERYRMSMGKTGSEIYFFIIIQRLSYKDAGVYTCEAVERRVSVSSCNCNGFPLSSTVELVLQVSIKRVMSNVRVTEGSMAVLKCEMMGYIRADEDMQWFKGEEQIYDRANGRFFITYEDGTPDGAQYGGNVTVPSRISVLQIISATVLDSGLYTCKVKGEVASSNTTLDVMESTTSLPPDSTLGSRETDNKSTPIASGGTVSPAMDECRAEQSRVVAITFGCTFLVTTTLSILLTSVVICLYFKLWQHRSKIASKSKSESPHPELAKSIVEHNESGKVISVVNTEAELVGVSPSEGDAQTN